MLQRGQDGLVSEVLGSRSCPGLPFTSCVTLSNLGNLFFLFYLCIYLFLATLGLCCCSQALASCSKWGINFPVAVLGPLIAGASLVAEHRLQSVVSAVVEHGLVTPGHIGSSQTRDRIRVPCIGR